MPMPDEKTIEVILRDTLRALADAFPGARGLADSKQIGRVAKAAIGLDGRQVRKLVAVACSERKAVTLDPGTMTIDDLVAAVAEVKSQ
jgi:hypothetical protein